MRTRVDGHKFEAEFERTFSKYYWLLRLPTLNTGYAGVRQPADYILKGNATLCLMELKETEADSFSLASMQQLPEMKDFIAWRKERVRLGYPMYYFVVVHFIKRGVIRVIEADTALKFIELRKALRYNTSQKYCFTFEDLEDMKENLIL